MEKNKEDKQSYILESSTELVSLNTMIPRSVRGQLEECMGWLQASEVLHRYSLQKTVKIAIETLYRVMAEERERLDYETVSEASRVEKVTVEAPRKDRDDVIVTFPKSVKSEEWQSPSGLKSSDIADMNTPLHMRVKSKTEEVPSLPSNNPILSKLGIKL